MTAKAAINASIARQKLGAWTPPATWGLWPPLGHTVAPPVYMLSRKTEIHIKSSATRHRHRHCVYLSVRCCYWVTTNNRRGIMRFTSTGIIDFKVTITRYTYNDRLTGGRIYLSSDVISNDPKWPLTQYSRARHYSTLSISKTVQDRGIVTLRKANKNSYAIYGMTLLLMTMTDLQPIF